MIDVRADGQGISVVNLVGHLVDVECIVGARDGRCHNSIPAVAGGARHITVQRPQRKTGDGRVGVIGHVVAAACQTRSRQTDYGQQYN